MVTASIESYLLASTTEVLESMCFTSVDQQLPGTRSRSLLVRQPELSVGRYLRFSGTYSGWFGVQTSRSAAGLIAGNLLGEDEDDLCEDQASEAIGEIANMICGAMLARIEGKQAFKLGTPEVWTSGLILVESHPVPTGSQVDEDAAVDRMTEREKQERVTAPNQPEVLQCLFDLDCGQMLVWIQVS